MSTSPKIVVYEGTIDVSEKHKGLTLFTYGDFMVFTKLNEEDTRVFYVPQWFKINNKDVSVKMPTPEQMAEIMKVDPSTFDKQEWDEGLEDFVKKANIVDTMVEYSGKVHFSPINAMSPKPIQLFVSTKPAKGLPQWLWAVIALAIIALAIFLFMKLNKKGGRK